MWSGTGSSAHYCSQPTELLRIRGRKERLALKEEQSEEEEDGEEEGVTSDLEIKEEILEVDDGE